MPKVVTFGEIMMRLSPPNHQRFSQCNSLDVCYGGAEANVAASLSHFGIETDYITRLPDNDFGDACICNLRQLGVGTSRILRGGERMGIYFLENGVAQRGSKVIYDRNHSAFADIELNPNDWEEILSGADWFHFTEITPSISSRAAKACLEGVRTARRMNLIVSCDMNYRANLWKWGKTAAEVMPDLVELCDILIGNEKDAERVFGIHPERLQTVSDEEDVFRQMSLRFPQLKGIASTRRGSISASHNTWSAIYWDCHTLYRSKSYDIIPIVDRVGGGDAFTSGLIYGLLTYKMNKQMALEFAVAASCLKHTIPGDVNRVSLCEVENLMEGDTFGGISR